MRTPAIIALLMTAGLTAHGQPPRVPIPELPNSSLAESIRLPLPPPSLREGLSPLPNSVPAIPADDRPYPITLATALKLAGSRPLDVLIAGQQVEAAGQRYDQARYQWIPNLMVGADYFYHGGAQQNFLGETVRQNRSMMTAGFGPNVVVSLTEAIYAPLAARQDWAARKSVQRAVQNDVTLLVAEAYFTVQQARGELAGAEIAVRHAEELSRRATALGEGLAPPLEATRARVELSRRKQAAAAARERWRLASAELGRLLRLEPGVLIEPVEAPELPITLIQETTTVETLIPIALQHRPELSAHQAVVQAAITRLRQEKMRPFLPSLALRSNATNPSGSIGYGAFAGGPGGRLGDVTNRFDIDLQVMWEFANLGFGNKARAGERKAEHMQAVLELFRTQDRIAAEVATEYARAKAAGERLLEAEPALRDALELTSKSLTGLSQTRRIGDTVTLVVRPQEVTAAIQSLGQSVSDFYSAVGDYNRAQFRLYRALGHPAMALPGAVAPAELPALPPALRVDGTLVPATPAETANQIFPPITVAPIRIEPGR